MKNRQFNSQTTADEVLEGIDLSGKRVLITGGSSGLGAETARAMAAKGAEVIITARSASKANEVIESIKTDSGATVEFEEVELSSLASIRTFSDRFLSKYDQLDILINNAGIMACPQGKTEDGFELQFGTNHLGHFLLTNLIMPTLINAKSSRIVCLSSVAHRNSPVLFNDINFTQTEYHRWVAYGQAKTANSLFAVELDKRLKKQGVRAYAVHPGVIMTPLMRHLPEGGLTITANKTVPQGAATQVYAATAPELDNIGGVYLSDCQICEVHDSSHGATHVRSWAVDPVAAHDLWVVSEKMLGQRFLG